MRYLRARSRLWLNNSTLIRRLKRQEPADELVALDALGRQGKIQVGIDRGGQGAQVFFLRFGGLLAIAGAVAWWRRLARRAELSDF